MFKSHDPTGSFELQSGTICCFQRCGPRSLSGILFNFVKWICRGQFPGVSELLRLNIHFLAKTSFTVLVNVTGSFKALLLVLTSASEGGWQFTFTNAIVGFFNVSIGNPISSQLAHGESSKRTKRQWKKGLNWEWAPKWFSIGVAGQWFRCQERHVNLGRPLRIHGAIFGSLLLVCNPSSIRSSGES